MLFKSLLLLLESLSLLLFIMAELDFFDLFLSLFFDNFSSISRVSPSLKLISLIDLPLVPKNCLYNEKNELLNKK